MKIQKEGFEFDVIDHEFWKDEGWERFTYYCIKNFSNSNKTFIDIGAWIGPISLVASKLNKNCHAIEPDHISFSQLKENINLNNIENITCHNIAITNKTEIITLGNDEEMGTSNTRINASKNLFKIQGKSLNEFINDLNISQNEISIVKIDTEGSEIDILQDSFFESYKGPLHLSIHTPFYLNKYESLEIVKKTISRYRYYISNLNVINKDINDINHLNEFYSIMLFN